MTGLWPSNRLERHDVLASKIRQCQQGRDAGFVWLLEEYGARLYGYFLRTTRSPADADDLLQELFVRLIEKIRHYRHQGRFDQWLFRVAANIARDHARKRHRRARVFSQMPDTDEGHETADLVSPEAPPDQKAQMHEQRTQLDKALGQLNPLDREIILLRHYGQLSFKEIAEHFEMPVGTALAKVHRGLKRLRKIMAGEKHGSQDAQR